MLANITTKNLFHTIIKWKGAYQNEKYTIIDIDSDFNAVDLTSNYTDILFTLPATASLSVDITHSEATGIIYPDKYEGLKKESIDKKEDIIKTSGIIGGESNPNGKIKIMIKSGNITFKENY